MATVHGTLHYRPANGNRHVEVPVAFTDEHESSSFGLPVMLTGPRRTAYGCGDLSAAAGEPVVAAVVTLDTDDPRTVAWVNAAGFRTRPRLRPEEQPW